VLKKKEPFPHWLSWSSSFGIGWQIFFNIDMCMFVQDFFCKGHFPFPNCYYIL
jgi:hypothetical protein